MSPAAGLAIDCVNDPVAGAMWLARAFTEGRSLWVTAVHAPDHAHHVAVECVHPVIAGTRPLPATAVDFSAFARVISQGEIVEPVRSREPLLLISDTAGDATADRFVNADLLIPTTQVTDAEVVLTYHLLWELVQVALEHPGLVGGDGVDGGDSTGFLYPFLDASEQDESSLRESLRKSARTKRAESASLTARSLADNDETLDAIAAVIADAALSNGTVLTMGNGGSATDAARLARKLSGQGVLAQALCCDYAVCTALANDLGAQRIFARQIDAFARPGDVLVGCSTSGASPNLLAAFDRADAMGVTTIGLSGYGGGTFVDHPSVSHTIVVQSQSVHRIQEAQAALMSSLCERVNVRRHGPWPDHVVEGVVS